MPNLIAYASFSDYDLLLLLLPDGAPVHFLWYHSAANDETSAVWRFLGLTLGRVAAGVG